MLKHPDTEIEFAVDLSYFLACFDTFDREEDFGEYLGRFDPNSECDLKKLFHERLLTGKLVEKYTEAHKYEVARCLEQALLDVRVDFALVMSRTRLEESGMCLPRKWCIHDPRKFFLTAYRCVFEEWNASILEAGYKLTPPNAFPI